jgi:hypothetical protein
VARLEGRGVAEPLLHHAERDEHGHRAHAGDHQVVDEEPERLARQLRVS